MAIVDKILTIFKERKVLQLIELIVFLNCSAPTVRRRLKGWGAYTSFNKNGRYYTLPNIPKFNEYGIWKYKGILFSKHGNLKKTFVYCIDQSITGLSVTEISEILGIPAINFLGHFKDYPNVQREKYEGVYIYFSKKVKIFEQQKKEREKFIQSECKMDLPSDADAVNILVEFIKHISETTELLVHRLCRKGHKIPIKMVRNLFAYHGLEKKTSDLDQSKR